MDWDDLMMNLFGGLALVAAAVLIFFTFFATHKVDGYYFGATPDSQLTCVYAHWTWHSDEKIFCTTNRQDAFDFVAKANSTLK